MKQFFSILLLLQFLVSCTTKLPNSNSHVFDKIYVVSLDRTPERFAEVKESLERAALKPTRFSATDGYTMLVTDDKTAHVMNGKEMWHWCNTNRDKKISYKIACDENPKNIVKSSTCFTCGETGVYCSMRRVWRDMLDNNYKHVLILEDDTGVMKEYTKTFNEQVALIVNNAPRNWDVIFLRLSHPHDKLYPARKIGSRDLNEYVWGVNRDPFLGVASCEAYIINRSFAEKMLLYTEEMRLPIDMQISEAINQRIINAYLAKKKLISSDEKQINSVISKMGRNDKGDLL